MIPSHFLEDHAVGLVQGEMIAQFEIGNYRNFVYLLLDWKTRKAAIVDPQFDLTLPEEALQQNGFELISILLTHTHRDHTAGVPEILKRNPNIPLFCHRDELHRLDTQIMNRANIKTVRDGDTLSVGEINIRVIHTPGHTLGECCYFIEHSSPIPYLLTGDTVFIRDCGRTDLDTGSTQQMFQSLQRIKKLPHHSVILPGHHYRTECASTLQKEIELSPPFQCKTVSELEALP